MQSVPLNRRQNASQDTVQPKQRSLEKRGRIYRSGLVAKGTPAITPKTKNRTRGDPFSYRPRSRLTRGYVLRPKAWHNWPARTSISAP